MVSSLGIMMVGTRRGFPDEKYGVPEDPLRIMKRAFLVTAILDIFGFALLCKWCLYVPSAPDAWKWFGLCGAIGIITAYLFVIITQYYTDYEMVKVQGIAEAS